MLPPSSAHAGDARSFCSTASPAPVECEAAAMLIPASCLCAACPPRCWPARAARSVLQRAAARVVSALVTLPATAETRRCQKQREAPCSARWFECAPCSLPNAATRLASTRADAAAACRMRTRACDSEERRPAWPSGARPGPTSCGGFVCASQRQRPACARRRAADCARSRCRAASSPSRGAAKPGALVLVCCDGLLSQHAL